MHADADDMVETKVGQFVGLDRQACLLAVLLVAAPILSTAIQRRESATNDSEKERRRCIVSNYHFTAIRLRGYIVLTRDCS